MKLYQLMFFITVCFYGTIYPQVTEEWVKRFDGTAHGWDRVYDITVDNSGNVYVVGTTQTTTQGQDYITIKYSPEGTELWTATYDGPINYHDQAYAVAVGNSGNVYVTGGSFGNGTERDYLTIKYTSDGDSLWTRRYNGPGYGLDEAKLIMLDDSENVFIAGYSDLGDNLDYYLTKYDSSGNQIWGCRWKGDGNGVENRPHDMTMDEQGYIYLTGESSNNLGNLDSYGTIKCNPSGDTVWTVKYTAGSTGLSQAYAIAVDDSSNVYVTGRSDPSNPFGTNFDIATVKYNSSGQTVWVHRYDGPQQISDVGKDLAIDNDGNILVTGGSESTFITIKLTPSGDTLWTARYGIPLGYAQSMLLDNQGNIFIAGNISEISIPTDIATVMYNPQGVLQWVESYSGPANDDDQAVKILLDEPGNVYVIGQSPGVNTGIDFVTIKYNILITTVDDNSTDHSSFILEQNYPNPFNPSTVIGYQLPVSGSVTLKVYDLLGNEIATLVDEYKPAGRYEVEFNSQSYRLARNLSSGIYFYRLEAGDKVENKKMLFLK